MRRRLLLLNKEIAVELDLPNNHDLAKRGYYLGYGRSAIYGILHSIGPISITELIELSDSMGFDDKELDLVYFCSPDAARSVVGKQVGDGDGAET